MVHSISEVSNWGFNLTHVVFPLLALFRFSFSFSNSVSSWILFSYYVLAFLLHLSVFFYSEFSETNFNQSFEFLVCQFFKAILIDFHYYGTCNFWRTRVLDFYVDFFSIFVPRFVPLDLVGWMGMWAWWWLSGECLPISIRSWRNCATGQGIQGARYFIGTWIYVITQTDRQTDRFGFCSRDWSNKGPGFPLFLMQRAEQIGRCRLNGWALVGSYFYVVEARKIRKYVP